MKRYPLLYGLVGMVLIAIFGYFTYSHLSVSAKTPETITPATIQDEEVELTISTFLHLLVEGHMKEAQEYTTGDTKRVLQSNQAQEVSGTLIHHRLDIRSLSSQFAQVAVDATVDTKVGKDRNHFLYTLIKQDQKWKILKIEEFPVILNNVEEMKLPDQVDNVIEQYLVYVSKSQWKESLTLLSGQARKEAEKTFSFLPKNLNTKIKVLNKAPVVVETDKALIQVDYEIKNDIQKNVEISTLFQMEDVGGEWKISQITNVGGGQ